MAVKVGRGSGRDGEGRVAKRGLLAKKSKEKYALELLDLMLNELRKNKTDEALRWYGDLETIYNILHYRSTYDPNVAGVLNVGLIFHNGGVEVHGIRVGDIYFIADGVKPTINGIRNALIKIIPEVYKELAEMGLVHPTDYI